jgi:hypothetical protein
LTDGDRGVALFAYPDAPATPLRGPNFAATQTTIAGAGVRDDGPEILESDLGEQWAVVTIDVEAGVLNVEDVLFRSRLVTDVSAKENGKGTFFDDSGPKITGS